MTDSFGKGLTYPVHMQTLLFAWRVISLKKKVVEILQHKILPRISLTFLEIVAEISIHLSLVI